MKNTLNSTQRRKGARTLRAFFFAPLILCVLALNAFSDVSTNKEFVVNNGTGSTTANKLPPSEATFFVVNSNLLNQAVSPNGGSSGSPQTPWQQNINGNGNTLSNAVLNNVTAGSLIITNLDVTNAFIGSNSYTAKTNFAGALQVTNATSLDAGKISTDGGGNLTVGSSGSGNVTVGNDLILYGTLTESALVGPGLVTVNSGGQFGVTDFTGTNSSALSGANTFVSVGTLLSSLGSGPGVLTNSSATSTPSLSWVAVGGGGGGGVTPAYSSQFQTVSLGTGTATNVTDYPTNFASLFPYVAGVSPVAIQGVDSLTSGNGSGAAGSVGISNYLMFASNYYGLRFAASTNLASNGEQLGTWSSNYTSILHPYAPGKGTNQFLFLWGGINDMSIYNETAEATYLFFTNIAYKAHQDGMIVVAMTCTYTSTNSPANAWEVYRYNNYLRNSATNWDYLVDVAAFIPPPSLNSNLYVNNGSDGLAPDIVHITNAGQQFIAYEMSNVLSRAPHALTTKYQEGFFGQLINTVLTNNNNNNTANILYGNLAINQSAGGLEYPTRDLNTVYAQTGTWAGAGFDNGQTAYGFSCFFTQSVNFYGWLTAADSGTEFMAYCGINGTNGVTFPNTSIYVRQSVVATNGFASYNTNVFTSVAPTSWSAQFSTINSGFTNIYGTNCTININGSVGYFVFYKGGGKTASTPAANPLFTNLLSTNGWSRELRCGDGVQVVPSIGNANVTVDF